MAATIVRSPKLSLSLPTPESTTSNLPSLNQSFFTPLPKRRRCISIYACTAGDQSNSAFGGEIKKGQAIELNKVNDENPYEFNAKDSPNPLPRPLTSADLSNMASEGSRLRVAYQGVRGAYSESAAEKAYPNCEAVPCEQFDTAFDAVERWLVDRAVLPIENSLGGSIHRNYDLLLRYRLHIVGEVKLAIRHCLLANNGVKIEDLKRVLSHPQALAQCENTLTKLGLVREAVDDTAGAAKYIAFSKLKDAGAVASLAASRIYGLNVLAQDIQDDSDNVTRFLMLAREPIIPRTDKPFKTSVVFSLDEGPGVLFKALAVFAMRSINLTKIESRPLQKQALRVLEDSVDGFPKYFPYLFYVDFEASMADQRAQNALGHLKEFATFLRVLGSYPSDSGIA
ncbi:arogenate dehydratase/prephenate dehydratase 2, chloroplastic-like [Solanum tuberosum]|uniref:Arogenate dehydratase n=2 Tax=Solanum TaxID=4107 RepID=M1CDP7_SOLTU|nr:PREDICTED: arogenate dehydratase/prephenate dehydratase 2, chloroplastic-like [Solanum tuberosum]